MCLGCVSTCIGYVLDMVCSAWIAISTRFLGLAMEGRYVYVFESDRDVDDAVKRLFGGSGG